MHGVAAVDQIIDQNTPVARDFSIDLSGKHMPTKSYQISNNGTIVPCAADR
jgi:hypothetical protein